LYDENQDVWKWAPNPTKRCSLSSFKNFGAHLAKRCSFKTIGVCMVAFLK